MINDHQTEIYLYCGGGGLEKVGRSGGGLCKELCVRAGEGGMCLLLP